MACVPVRPGAGPVRWAAREEQALCELGGFVHDLGKVGIPDEILLGDGPLDDEMFAVMKTHPVIGVDLSDLQPLGWMVHEAVRSHHERPDGRGYPDGLAADRIPVTAAVVGLADAFDAMTSDRPYRRGMPMNRVLGIVREGSGTQFDTRWATVLLDQVPAETLEHVVGHSADGVPLEDCPMCGGPLARPTDSAESLPPCRICGAELADTKEGIRPTGRRAAAESLAPRPDRALIATLADSLVPYVQ